MGRLGLVIAKFCFLIFTIPILAMPFRAKAGIRQAIGGPGEYRGRQNFFPMTLEAARTEKPVEPLSTKLGGRFMTY